VMVGPEPRQERPAIAELTRLGAKEAHLRIEPGDLSPSTEFQIYPEIWRCWILRLCLVRGTLLRRVVSGGIPTDLPVCNATVSIYDVESLWIILVGSPTTSSSSSETASSTRCPHRRRRPTSGSGRPP